MSRAALKVLFMKMGLKEAKFSASDAPLNTTTVEVQMMVVKSFCLEIVWFPMTIQPVGHFGGPPRSLGKACRDLWMTLFLGPTSSRSLLTHVECISTFDSIWSLQDAVV